MLRLSPDAVYRDLDGEAVVLDLATGTYFGLNAVATLVWRGLDDGQPLPVIVETIAAEYAIERAVVERDVDGLLRDLEARGLVIAGG